MHLFDEVLLGLRGLLPGPPDVRAAYDVSLCAPDGEKDRILFRSDTAYELGGGGKPSVCGVLYGDLPEETDEVLVYGPDLSAIAADAPFAHFTVVDLPGETEETAYYERLKQLGFTVFQVYPRGYHVRISPSAGKEQARVAKAALAGPEPLSFVNVGCSLIREFKAREPQAGVRTVYITDPHADYAALAGLAAKARGITEALRHTLETSELDCAACKMKPICDTVEGLRELHFRKEKQQ